jgi:glycosyltransferase involved in cell wall biosynthesis
MKPIVSIIIPCYKTEKTLSETLQSVLDQNFNEWEALIINDGSPDAIEDIALNWVKKDSRFKYFSKQNEGLAKTRNYGIAKALGEYILPLDSDNLVAKDFIKDAIQILDSNTTIGVVHGHAEYFGERSGLWKVDPFELNKILIGNYIDACVIYRKELWLKIGGYDEKMPFQGHEDWDFWISLGTIDVKFHHLNKVTFYYFVAYNSMIRSFSPEMLLANKDYLVKKHSFLIHNSYKYYYRLHAKFSQKPILFLFKIIIKKYFYKQ